MSDNSDHTQRRMTPDELEQNGYPRNYFDLSFTERISVETERIRKNAHSEVDADIQDILEQTAIEEAKLSAQDRADLNQMFEDTSDYNKDPDRFLKRAKLMVIGSYNSTHEVPDQLEVEQLYIVWFAKTLKNWKALISTSIPDDGLYFEVIYDGEKLQTYVDTYRKEDNQVFSHHDN